MCTEIAKIIYEQLGGYKFRMMTGAKQFVGDNKSLTFKLPRKGWVKIILNGKDLYDVELIAYNRARKILSDIYCDQLVHILEQQTGLYFSL